MSKAKIRYQREQIMSKLNNNFSEVEEEPKKENYIFGDALGSIMAKVSMRFQYEASMMSMLMMMLGLTATTIYIIGWTNFSLFFKIMTGINGFFGVLFMWSYLVTTFQQYNTYMAVENLNKKEED